MKKNNIRTTLLACVTCTFLLASCQLPGLPRPEEPPVVLEVEKQQELAEKKYFDLHESTARMPRVEKRDILVEGFKEVIAKYPDSSFAHESHYHLMRSYLYNYDFPREKEAEEVYDSYFKKYDNPMMGNTIHLEMAKYYYQFKIWKKLESFTIPFMQEFVATGKMRDGLILFYYSEAKFNLKDYKEALRGYVTYANLYQKNKKDKFVLKRLKEIRHMLSVEEEGSQ